MEDTFELYKKALKEKYEQEKTGINANFLLNPSPANLRNLALIIFEDIIDQNDLKIFELFMGFEYKVNTIQRIKNETDKFKPLGTFLKGKTELSNYNAADMLAVLLDINPRPYRYFHKKHKDIKPPRPIVIINEYKTPVNKQITTINLWKNNRKKITFLSITAGVLAVLGGVIYSTKKGSQKNCMVWNIDHYEVINCNETKQGFIYSTTHHADEKLLTNFKKVTVDSNTLFFDTNKRPLIWYGKNANKEYEYFTYPGLHPETGKTLKPITPYIIKKYIK